jgi:hypothetical protein
MTRSIEGIDRALPRFRQHVAQVAILRHATEPTTQPQPRTSRETPDRIQVIGIPLFIQRTPPWRRQDWAEPQTPPTRITE